MASEYDILMNLMQPFEDDNTVPQSSELTTSIRQMETQALLTTWVDALEIYANQDNWRSFVPDRYSGECWEFDWPGEVQDKPWEVAAAALHYAKRILGGE